MKPIPENILELLPNILEGIADDQQQREWNAWLTDDKAHQEWFDEMKSIWNVSAQELSPISAEASWQALLQKRNQRRGSSLRLSYRTLSLAASLLLLIGLGVWYLFIGTVHSKKQFAFSEDKQVALPDGTVVYSPGNALIEYPSVFNAKIREVTQHKGMAFYEVTKNPEKPFVIHSRLADIKVLGTSFQTIVTTDSVEVIVASGKVAVYREKDTVTLLPGEKVVYYANASHTDKTVNRDMNFLFWKTGILEYRDMPIALVLEDLQSKLAISIQFDSTKMGSRRLSGRYHAGSPEDVLGAITETLDLAFFKEKDTYIITNK
jgi:ferric-dicitrate binding protein FerR (iron transport regulator)